MLQHSYRASLKNPRVEEPIDLLIHRPLGYLIARASLNTPITPDALTIASMLVGLGSAAAFIAANGPHAWAPVAAGALLIFSAVLDCSDGQLARMRGSSSRYGRMLDGLVDILVQVVVLPAGIAHMIWHRGGLGAPGSFAWIAASIAACIVGHRHTSLYDQLKNVYVRNTDANPKDCDDPEVVEAEWNELRASGGLTLFAKLRLLAYGSYLKASVATLRMVDPYVPMRFASMPAYTPERAARYRELNDPLMRWWGFFGVGTHIFLISVCAMLDQLEWYVLIRLFGFSALMVVLVPLQRRASRAFFGDAFEDPSPASAVEAVGS